MDTRRGSPAWRMRAPEQHNTTTEPQNKNEKDISIRLTRHRGIQQVKQMLSGEMKTKREKNKDEGSKVKTAEKGKKGFKIVFQNRMDGNVSVKRLLEQYYFYLKNPVVGSDKILNHQMLLTQIRTMLPNRWKVICIIATAAKSPMALIYIKIQRASLF